MSVWVVARHTWTRVWASRVVVGAVAAGLFVFVLTIGAPVSAAAKGRGSGRLVIRVTGLPKGQRPAVVVTGPGLHDRLRSTRLVVGHAQPGGYLVEASVFRISRGAAAIVGGAQAIPSHKRIRVVVRRGHRSTATVRYPTIVNPGVVRAPNGLVAVLGPDTSPRELVYRGNPGLPRVGAVVVAAPSSRLPDGLIARVTSKQHARGKARLSVQPEPFTAAVPQFSFAGVANLHPAVVAGPSADSAALRSQDESPCSGAPPVIGRASLDQFQVRQASASLFPDPQLTLDLALRTTEHLDLSAAAAVSCEKTLHTLGPWTGEIPTPVGPIPVYAQIPVTAHADLSSALAGIDFNVASTHNLSVQLGSTNRVSLDEQGSNVWTSGGLSWTGDASFGLSMGLEFGIGNPHLGDFHLTAGVDADVDLNSDQGCSVDMTPGHLDAGIKVGPFDGSAKLWSAKPIQLWQGCASPYPTPTPRPTPGIVTLQDPVAQSNTVGANASLQVEATDTAGGKLTYSATALPPGLNIDSKTGLINGTPTAVGSYTPTITAADSTGPSAHQAFDWQITNQSAPPPDPGRAVAVSAGPGETCAVLASGRIDCWGIDDAGQLGIADDSTLASCVAGTACSLTPVQVSGITDAVSVTVGGQHACALLANGSIECWGSDAGGALGDADDDSSGTPVPVAGISDALAVAATDSDNTCALLQGGQVDCWGPNEDGEVGNGTTTEQDTPTPVELPDPAVDVEPGRDSTCALLTDHTVECWGDNQYGELGDGTIISTLQPDQSGLTGIPDVSQIASPEISECAALQSGSVECWGSADDEELGIPPTSAPDVCSAGDPCSKTPLTVAGIQNVEMVTDGGGTFSCALLSGGSVSCWGWNGEGELGTGTNLANSDPEYAPPSPVTGLSNATEISSGNDQTCALLNTGGIDCWGRDWYGELGDAQGGQPTAQSDSPTPVLGIP
jgi:alpha-tubulin suppressor-like RCC1 family protein